MADYNTNIDIEKAKNLKREIETEFTQVSDLLRKVTAECEANPAEEDSVLQAIDQASKELNNAWSNLARGFEDAMETLGNIISQFAEWVETKVEQIDEYKSKIKL